MWNWSTIQKSPYVWKLSILVWNVILDQDELILFDKNCFLAFSKLHERMGNPASLHSFSKELINITCKIIL